MSGTLPLSGATALVTGATGFTGNRLVRMLVEKGVDVRAIARPSSNIDVLRDCPITWIRGDVFAADVVRSAVEGVEFIFHLAACYREPGAPDDIYRRVHVESTQLLAREAAKQPRFRRFVHTSTMGVHGHVADPPGNECSPYGPGDVYQETKLEAEQWLHQYAAESGLPFTVIRPAAIFGPGDRRLLKLFKFARRGWFPLVGGHNTLYHLIHVDDLARAFLLAAVHDHALGEAFICGNDEYTDVRQIISWLADYYGKRARFVSIPSRPLFAAADLCEWICKPFGIDPPLYRRRMAFFTKDRAFDTSKIRERLGFSCCYDNQRGLLQTARAYDEMGW